MAADTWFGADRQVAGQKLTNTGAVAFRPAVARVVFRVPTGVGSMLVDSWAAMVRAIDSVLTAELLMRLVVYAGIRCRARASSFALIIIAACQRHIARVLNDEGLPTPTAQAKWDKSHVWRVLGTLYMQARSG